MRLSFIARSLAAAALVAGSLAVAPAVGAQTCPYNSTQSTCACPTSGAGTSCFGGQLFRASDNSCQNDLRPCATNQNWSCTTDSCVCNTASYPCGGCTAASSTVGASCSAPTGGQYTNQCGTCACPSGTTLCPSSNACIANRSCPAGTTWDPCTDTCGTPNVLLSPGFTQNGYINIAGDINERAGNVRLDFATNPGQGDLYMGNGKALRVDGSGVTNLNIANYGSGGTGLNVNFPAGSQLCFGGACRNSWPSTTDFNPVYVDATGDTMTGDLNLTGATSDLFVAGNVGIGTTTPVDGRLEIVRPSTSYRANLIYGTGANNDWEIGELNTNGSFTFKRITSQPVVGSAVMTFDTADNVGIGTQTPGAKLDVFGTAKMLGFQLATGAGAGKVLTSDASGLGTWQTPAGVTGSGTANALAKFTGATTLGNSRITDDGTTVVIAPGTPSRVAVGLSAAAGQDGAIALGLRANASGYYSTAIGQDSAASNSAALAMGGGSAIASGFMSTAIGSYVTASGNMSATFGSGVSTSSPLTNSTGNSLAVGFNSTVPTLFVGPASGAGTYGNVGIGTTSPAQRLDVNGNASVSGNAAVGGYAISAANNGQGGGAYVSTNSSLNGIAALRVVNSGAGAGLDIDGGSAGNGAFIKGAGSNVALEVANYNYPGANTIGTVMQVRRGPGSGTLPAAGMGVRIGFPLQGDSAGSFNQGGGLGAVIESQSPWKTGLFFETVNGYTMAEKMRLTGDGRLGIGTTNPSAMLTVQGGSTALGSSATASGQYSLAAGYGPTASGSYSIALGDRNTATNNTAVAIGAQADATGYYAMALGNYAAATGTGSIAIGGGIDTTRKMTVSGNATIGLGYGSTVPTLTVTSAPNTAGTYGKVGIGTSSPAQLLDVNGDVALSGKHAFRSSDSWLRLNQDGAFTSGVHTPGNFAPGALNVGGANGWGDPGFGNAWISGNLVVYGSMYLGWWRSTWPNISTTTASASLYAASRSWQYVGCPSGYSATGGSAINCEYLGGWGCFQEQLTSSGLYVIVGAGNTASAWVRCIQQQ